MTAALWVHTLAAMDRIIGGDPVESDPFLKPAPASEPDVLDATDAAWGLGSAHPGYPPRAAARAARAALPDPCGHCGGTGFVVTHEDGGAGYRPCYRCPKPGGAA